VPFPEAQPDNIGEAIDRELATLTPERDALRAQIAPLEARIGRLLSAKAALDESKTPVARAGFGSKTELVLSILAESGHPLRCAEVRDIAVARGLKESSPNYVFTILGTLARRGRVRRVAHGIYEAVTA
jgi:pyrroline-5-carboxylate reductase